MVERTNFSSIKWNFQNLSNKFLLYLAPSSILKWKSIWKQSDFSLWLKLTLLFFFPSFFFSLENNSVQMPLGEILQVGIKLDGE